MKRSFCRALCVLLCCVLLLGISACAKADRVDPASSAPPVETQQTETTAETEKSAETEAAAQTEESGSAEDMADETTSESINEYTEPDGTNTKERYIQNDDGTEEDFVEKWKDGQKQYDGHWLYDQNENPISMQEVIYHYDDDGALIRILENEFIWNDDGGTTLINAAELFQDYEGSLKGYKTKQIKKDRADGTTYEFHGEYWYPDGRYSKAGFTTNANGVRENYSEEWKDGKKVSK